MPNRRKPGTGHLKMAVLWLSLGLALCVGTSATAQQVDGAAKDGFLRQATKVAFETCPKLLSKPAPTSDVGIAERDGFQVERTAFDLLRTPVGDAGQIIFGKQIAYGFEADGTTSMSDSCVVAVSSPFRDDAQTLIVEELIRQGFVFDRKTWMVTVYKKPLGQHVQKAVLFSSEDGGSFEFVSNPDLPVAYFTLVY